MNVVIVVAIAENGVIGNEGGLPWRLSSDLKRFKADTMGRPIVMGRKTWEGLPKRPLPGRQNIVVTRTRDYRADGADVVQSLGDALALARVRGRCAPGIDEVCIVGGGQIYREALPLADMLKVTHVLASPEGDTRFPDIDPDIWDRISSQHFPAGDKDSHATLYAVYQRRGNVH